MNNISTLKINLLLEQVYLEGQVHMMYENILKEDDNISESESKSLLKKVLEDLKINTDFIMTFGVSIVAFTKPVKELLANKGVNITEEEVLLLVVTAMFILLTKSRDDIDTLMRVVKEHKLEKEVKGVVKFINSTLSIFKIVGNKVGVTVTTLVDALAFTFLSVPIMNTITSLVSEQGFTMDNIQQMLSGLLLSAGSYLVKNILKKKF